MEKLVSRKRGKPNSGETDTEVREAVQKYIKEPIMKGFGPT